MLPSPAGRGAGGEGGWCMARALLLALCGRYLRRPAVVHRLAHIAPLAVTPWLSTTCGAAVSPAAHPTIGKTGTHRRRDFFFAFCSSRDSLVFGLFPQAGRTQDEDRTKTGRRQDEDRTKTGIRPSAVRRTNRDLRQLSSFGPSILLSEALRLLVFCLRTSPRVLRGEGLFRHYTPF